MFELLAAITPTTQSPVFISFVQDLFQGVFVIAGAAIASGFITTAITQALKWEAIKIPAEKYPVPVAVILSIGTSAAAVYLTGLVDLIGWTSWLVMAVATLFVSTQTYKIVKDAVDQLKHPLTSASTAPANPEDNVLPPPTDGNQDGILNRKKS